MQVALEPSGKQVKSLVVAPRHIEIMDTTLRDGEQTSGVSFSASEKLTIAQLLLRPQNVVSESFLIGVLNDLAILW